MHRTTKRLKALCGQMQCCFLAVLLTLLSIDAVARQKVDALYLAIADHYAALVAYERYRDAMQHADFSIRKMPSWDLLRAAFLEGQSDLAFSMSPLALDMYQNKPSFKWVGLMHRNGSAFAVNDVIATALSVKSDRVNRKPSTELVEYLGNQQDFRSSLHVATPHRFSTHGVVLHRYLQQHGLNLGLNLRDNAKVLLRAISPKDSPVFLRSHSNRSKPAAMLQSLPWGDVAESNGEGKVLWYSKDVMTWPGGHVECIMLASNSAIKNKEKAVAEVIYFLHKAGEDIERARASGGEEFEKIIDEIRRHVPSHSADAIRLSLSADVNAISYKHLNIDKGGLKQIMDYAIEASIIDTPVDLDVFADERFNVQLPEIANEHEKRELTGEGE